MATAIDEPLLFRVLSEAAANAVRFTDAERAAIKATRDALASATWLIVPAERVRAAESDGHAQAVCRALAYHQAHGGTIPWPSIERPLNEWKEKRR